MQTVNVPKDKAVAFVIYDLSAKAVVRPHFHEIRPGSLLIAKEPVYDINESFVSGSGYFRFVSILSQACEPLKNYKSGLWSFRLVKVENLHTRLLPYFFFLSVACMVFTTSRLVIVHDQCLPHHWTFSKHLLKKLSNAAHCPAS